MRRSLGVLFLASLLVALLSPAAPALAGREQPSLPTPALIERDVVRGELDRATADLYLASAFGTPADLPAEYRSDVPWHGTVPLLHLRERLAGMPQGTERRAIREALAGTFATCSTDSGGVNNTSSTYFYIEYDTIGGGLNITQYATSLDTSWNTEVNTFGWAAPPVAPVPAPGSKYHVVVANLGSGLYGYVSSAGTHAGPVGNNPNTTWNDVDAQASCMVLNSNYDPFPGDPQQALDATTAHEFAHSVQFGYGAITGANAPDQAFIEGGATWIEDEVFDASNDNYNYLWPTFTDDMGSYGSSPYPYWVVFRALTERFGTGAANAGEQVMEDFWELTSQSTSSNMLPALNAGLVSKGTNLADAYHAAAIALKFNRPCTGGYVYPYCLEEGPGYVAQKGSTPLQGTISSVPGNFTGSVPDNYALNWVALPTSGGSYNVTLSNTSTGGQLRGTVACDTGSGLALAPFPAVAGPSSTTTVTGYSPSGCSSVVAVITNQSQTADNPASSLSRSYTLSTAAGADTTPPETTITSGPSGTVNSTSATFEFTSSEPGSFACSLDGGAFNSCTSPRTYTGLGQGSHTFQVRATDGAGNTDPTPASRTWTVDTVPPETTITSGPSGTVNSSSASFSFTSSEPGSTFACSLDGGAYEACSSPRSYTGLSVGPHTFRVRATDPAGNTDGSPAERTWNVAPQVHARQVSLSLKKHLQARGSVTASDGFASCLDGEAVQIQRLKKGNWSTVRMATTVATGSYKAKLPDKAAKYRAVLAESAAGPLNLCGAAQSAPRKHRHV
jgi:hypothetical protein